MLNKLKNNYIQGKKLLSFSFLKAIGQGMEMFTPLLIAGLIAPDFFGKYSLAKMIIFFFSTFFLASSATPFIIYANKENQQTKKINKTNSIQFIIIIFSIIFFLSIIILFSEQLKIFAGLSTWELLILFPAFIGIILKLFGENLCLALDQRLKSSLVGIVFGASVLLFTLLLIFFRLLNFQLLFFSYFISGLLILITFNKVFINKKLFPFLIDKKLTKKFMLFTSWQAIGLTAVYFINWGDNLVLRHFVSMEEIGVYNLGYQIFKGLITATFIISSYFMPFITKNINDKKVIKNYLNKKRPLIIITSLFILFLFYFSISPIFKIFYGSEYSQSVLVLKILIIPVIFQLFTIFYLPILNSLEKYKFIQIINIIAIILNVVLNIILVKQFGIFGAAIGTTIIYIFMFFAYLIYIKKLKLFPVAS